MVADACQNMLRDSKAVHEFAQQNESAAKGMARWLDKWFTKLRDVFSRSAQLSEEARLMDRLEQEVKKAFGELWDEALREAVATHDRVGDMENPATEGGEQNMAREEIDYDNIDGSYSWNNLTSKRPMHLTTINDNIGKDGRDVLTSEAMAYARKVGNVNENNNPVITIKDSGEEVIIGRKGLRHGLDRRMTINGPITRKIADILENSIRVNELNPREDSVDKSNVYLGAAKNQNNEPYIVAFEIDRRTHKLTTINVLYSANAKNIESAGSFTPEITKKFATLTDSDIRIADLLELVNTLSPDILSESVLRHFGRDSRPEGKLGASALYSERDYNETVVLEESTIDKYLADYASKSSPNYAQAYIVRMRPDDFLKLAKSMVAVLEAVDDSPAAGTKAAQKRNNAKKIPSGIREAAQVRGGPIPNGIIHRIAKKGLLSSQRSGQWFGYGSARSWANNGHEPKGFGFRDWD